MPKHGTPNDLEPTKERVAICPALEKPGAMARANKALELKNHAAYDCYMSLDQLLNEAETIELANGPGSDEPSLALFFYDKESGQEVLNQAREACIKWRAANEAFMNIIAGID